MSDEKTTLGFIGIGLMGKPMVLRLLDAGFCVHVWNRSPEKLTPVTNAGAKACASIAELVNISDVSCNVLVIAEMIALAKQAGVAAEKIPEALAGGFADSGPLQIVGPEMAAETFEPVKWRVKTLLKDLTMAIDLSTKKGNAIPMSGLAAQLMQLHASHGYLEQDPLNLDQIIC